MKSRPHGATIHDLASLLTDEEALKNQHVFRLNAEDSLAFVRALFEDSEPNENQKRAAEDYRKWVAGIDRE